MSSTARRALAGLTAVALLAPAQALLAAPAHAATPADGNIVVARVGTGGSSALSSAAAPVFLAEYSSSGALVKTVALPTAASGSNRPLMMSGSASSEGALTLSPDGRYLAFAGYAAAPGTTSVASTLASGTPRVVARLGSDGAVDTSTAITDAFSGNNIRAPPSTTAAASGRSAATAGGGSPRWAAPAPRPR